MRAATKILIVEGLTEKRVIPELMEANGVAWPRGHEPVQIAEAGGFDRFLADRVLNTYLMASGVEAVGVVFDADELTDRRWDRVRAHAKPLVVHPLPATLPSQGLIVPSTRGPRLGFWMMPDNQVRGMLETFLHVLVPERGPASLWELACQACDHATKSGKAQFGERGRDKAQIYTWLAWQHQPGRQLHQAICEKQLAAGAPGAKLFVEWFRGLFGV